MSLIEVTTKEPTVGDEPTIELVSSKKMSASCFPPDCDPAHCSPPNCFPPFCKPNCKPCNPDDECQPTCSPCGPDDDTCHP